MTNTISRRRSSGLRVYFLDDHQVHRIYFYRNGEVILACQSAWIERLRDIGSYSGEDMPGLTLSTEIRRSTKLNLTKGGHFYISSGTNSFYARDRTYDIYVDLAIGDCSLGCEQTVKMSEDDQGCTFHKVRSLTAIFDAAGQQNILVLVPNSQVVVPNAFGVKVAEIQKILNELGERTTNISVIVKNKKIIDLLVEAHAIYGSQSHEISSLS